MSKGLFISFEGGEGAGKTTLITRIESYLHDRGKHVICTREPGGTKAAEDIRALLVNGDKDRWDATSETALFLAARRMHVKELIEPALNNGAVVLCDRFLDSTLVYQGIAKKLGVDHVNALSKLVVGDLAPNRTFLIDIAPEMGLKRTGERAGGETRFEDHGLAFHQSIRNGFLTLAQENPERIIVLDGAQTADQVFEAAVKHLDTLI